MRHWAVCLAVLCAVGTAAALSGTLRSASGEALPFAQLVLMDQDFTRVLGHAVSGADGGFSLPAPGGAAHLVAQPPAKEHAAGLHAFAHQPRIYAVPADAKALDLRLPAAAGLVLEGYDASGRRMRWEDYTRLGQHGGMFAYATNLDDEMIPAAVWPVHGKRNGTTPADARERGLPAVLAAPGAPVCVKVMFWPTGGYGKLMLRADNAGAGYTLDGAGALRVLHVNVELARTAVTDLERRRGALLSGAEAIAALRARVDTAAGQVDADPAGAAKAADGVLTEALALRDQLELERARAAWPAARQGTLRVEISGLDADAAAAATVTVTPRAQHFLWGAYEGTEAGPRALAALRPMGFNYATVLPAWGWSENPASKRGILDDRFGISRLHGLGMTVKAHGVVWLQEYGILPTKALTMPHDALRAALLKFAGEMLATFGDEMALWEIMNEPATTNLVGMDSEGVFALFRDAAAQIRAAGKPGLVNSLHEFSHGAKHLIHGIDNRPVDDHPRTYSVFLRELEERGELDAVDIVGLQCYPGFRLNEGQFGGQQGPAYTPSHLLDTLDRYVRFGKPLHITEISFPSSYERDAYAGYWKAPWTPEIQAEYAELAYTLAFAHPQVHSVTWWDVLDDNAAVVGGGLHDRRGASKPVLDRMVSLLAEWTPKESVHAAAALAEPLPLLGGEYTVRVEAPGAGVREAAVTVLERWDGTLRIDFSDAAAE